MRPSASDDAQYDQARSTSVRTAAFYAAAVAAGAKDNGPPGPRPQYHENYDGAFVLDPDGHNIEAVIHTPRAANSGRHVEHPPGVGAA